jgi:biotin carboxyl carrier protein
VLVNGQPFVVGLDGTKVLVDGAPYDVQVGGGQAIVSGISYSLGVEGLDGAAETGGHTIPQNRAGLKAGRAPTSAAAVSQGAVTAIMPGKIIRVLVAKGDTVAAGDVVCLLEAMKMENELKAPRAGTIKALYAQPGQDVERGMVLAEIE